jgi:hypothetical protein
MFPKLEPTILTPKKTKQNKTKNKKEEEGEGGNWSIPPIEKLVV